MKDSQYSACEFKFESKLSSGKSVNSDDLHIPIKFVCFVQSERGFLNHQHYPVLYHALLRRCLHFHRSRKNAYERVQQQMMNFAAETDEKGSSKSSLRWNRPHHCLLHCCSHLWSCCCYSDEDLKCSNELELSAMLLQDP